ncbi:hypothetical protein BKA65DRAFT_543024 [Rhexocercosporidium sp. MPI-PUGE-AT-0058]|nr:hypothetical protein BKA65DRAFT_543024 [Rhexocercosporidium sp. MPI-PUGE-AT-0058]
MSSWKCTVASCKRILPFTRKQDRDRHVSDTHGTPKKCPWCPKTYGRYYKVRAHIHTEHRRAIEQPIFTFQQYPTPKICPCCNFVSFDDHNLLNHIDTCHKRQCKKGSRTMAKGSPQSADFSSTDMRHSSQLGPTVLEQVERRNGTQALPAYYVNPYPIGGVSEVTPGYTTQPYTSFNSPPNYFPPLSKGKHADYHRVDLYTEQYSPNQLSTLNPLDLRSHSAHVSFPCPESGAGNDINQPPCYFAVGNVPPCAAENQQTYTHGSSASFQSFTYATLDYSHTTPNRTTYPSGNLSNHGSFTHEVTTSAGSSIGYTLSSAIQNVALPSQHESHDSLGYLKISPSRNMAY